MADQDGAPRTLDVAASASIDIMTLNNKIVKMRKMVRKAKGNAILSLKESIRRLKFVTGNDEELEAAKTRQERLAEEVQVIRDLNYDHVSKFAFGCTRLSYDEFCQDRNLELPAEKRALIRLSYNKIIRKTVSEFRKKHKDWKELSAFLLCKQSGRRIKKGKKKVRPTVNEAKTNVKTEKLMVNSYLEEKLGKDKKLSVKSENTTQKQKEPVVVRNTITSVSDKVTADTVTANVTKKNTVLKLGTKPNISDKEKMNKLNTDSDSMSSQEEEETDDRKQMTHHEIDESDDESSEPEDEIEEKSESAYGSDDDEEIAEDDEPTVYVDNEKSKPVADDEDDDNDEDDDRQSNEDNELETIDNDLHGSDDDDVDDEDEDDEDEEDEDDDDGQSDEDNTDKQIKPPVFFQSGEMVVRKLNLDELSDEEIPKADLFSQSESTDSVGIKKRRAGDIFFVSSDVDNSDEEKETLNKKSKNKNVSDSDIDSDDYEDRMTLKKQGKKAIFSTFLNSLSDPKGKKRKMELLKRDKERGGRGGYRGRGDFRFGGGENTFQGRRFRDGDNFNFRDPNNFGGRGRGDSFRGRGGDRGSWTSRGRDFRGRGSFRGGDRFSDRNRGSFSKYRDDQFSGRGSFRGFQGDQFSGRGSFRGSFRGSRGDQFGSRGTFRKDNFGRRGGSDRFNRNDNWSSDRKSSPWKSSSSFGHKTEESAEKLHPSWEASKKRKEQGGIQAFQGKKIKFDDD